MELDLERYETHTIQVVVDRLVLRDGIERRLTESMETALQLAEGIAEIQVMPGRDEPDAEPEIIVFSQHLSRPSDGKSFDEIAPRNFSFNSPYGACTHCDGLGTVFEVDERLVVPDPEATIDDGAIAPWSSGRSRYFSRLVEAVCAEKDIPTDVAWEKLSKAQRKLLMRGGMKQRVTVRYKNRFGRQRTLSLIHI